MLILKQFVAFLLSFALVFITTFSYAADGNQFRDPLMWQRERTLNDAIKKSTVQIDAQRNYPVTVTNPTTGAKHQTVKIQKSTIKVAANAGNVAKKLLKGGGTVAIGVAVYDILGKSVDWVLDPANNAVKYKEPEEPGDGRFYKVNNDQITTWSANKTAACKAVLPIINKGVTENAKYRFGSLYGEGSMTCRLESDVYGNNYQYLAVKEGGEIEDIYKRIPMPDIADRVIANADSGDEPSMQVMTDTALDALEKGLLDSQFNSAAEPKVFADNESDPLNGSDTNTPNPQPNPQPNPDGTCPAGSIKQSDGTCLRVQQADEFVLPAFCDWASYVCDFIDWVKQPAPEDTETNVDIETTDIMPANTDIEFGGSCPANFGYEGSIFGNPISIVLLDTAAFCNFLSVYVKYPVIAVSSLFALYIYGGRKDG